MNNKQSYRVLWVDDDESIVEGTILDADEYNIMLDRYSNWQDAENALKNNFEEYSAIILDAFCQYSPSESAKEVFISVVLSSLSSIFGERKRFIPWYILSAGTMDYFSQTIQVAEYKHQSKEWGQMLYVKDVPDDDPKNSRFLYENIVKVAKSQSNNVVLFRHSEVFSYLGKEKLIDERARKLMLHMLGALYFPEDNVKFEFEGNPLRRVVEYIFRAARKIGVLTDDCFDKNDRVNLQDASKYLAGITINCYDNKRITHMARWGVQGSRKDGSDSDHVFPNDIAPFVKNILLYSNTSSHTKEDAPFFVDEDNKECFFSYVMQLCHVIKWFGKYAETHHDIEVNKRKQQRIEIPQPGHSEESKEKTAEELKENTAEKSKEKISDESKEEARTNDNISEKKDSAPSTFVIPSINDLMGKAFLIMDDKGLLHCGCCKLDSSIPYKAFQQVVLDEIIKNEDNDKEQYPYVVMKVTLAT